MHALRHDGRLARMPVLQLHTRHCTCFGHHPCDDALCGCFRKRMKACAYTGAQTVANRLGSFEGKGHQIW
jgi:hypothetical protein